MHLRHAPVHTVQARRGPRRVHPFTPCSVTATGTQPLVASTLITTLVQLPAHSHTGHDRASNRHMPATHNYKGQYPQPLAAVRSLCKVPLAVLEMHAMHPCTRFRQGKKHLQRSPLRAVIVVDAHLTRLPSVLTRKPSIMPVGRWGI